VSRIEPPARRTGLAVNEGSRVQRAIPPDPSLARAAGSEGSQRHESVGDLHLAGDNFLGAAEAYRLALAATGPDDPHRRVRLHLSIARALLQGGQLDEAERAAHEARRESRVISDSVTSARVAYRLASILVERGLYRPARRYALYAFAVLRDTSEHEVVAWVGVTMGFIEMRLGRPQAAIEWLQSAAATFRRIDHADGLVMALNNLGLIHKNLREWREAMRYLEQALSIDERKGLFARMRYHNQNIGLIRYRLGQWDLAEENFRQALRISRETAHAGGEATALLALGMLARRRRQPGKAEEHYTRALDLASRAGAMRDVQIANEFLAELAIDRGDAAAALERLLPALEDVRVQAPEGDMEAELSTRTGLAYLAASDLEQAQRHLLRGYTLAEKLGDRVESALALRAIARLEALRGQPDAMEHRLREAAQVFEQLSEPFELAVTLASWAENLLLLPASLRLHRPLETVADAVRRSTALFRQLGVTAAAAEAQLSYARLESERERYDVALGLLEQAEQWLGEDTDEGAAERAVELRRELERQYVAVSLSTCNEFRALEEANRLFRETSDMEGLLAQIVKLAVEHAGGDRGFLAFSSSLGRLDVVAQHGLGQDRARRILRVLETVAGTRLAENGPLFSSRLSADPRFGSALTDALDGVGSLVSVPLNFPSQAVGLVYVDRLNDNLLGAFRQRELNLLAVLANSAAVAIVEAQRSLLLAENQQLRDRLRPIPGSERVVTQSRELASVMSLLRKVGDTPATLLFVGETGTGKGLLAQVVHEISNRRDAPFVQVNCAALPEQLLESELFGYVQGAFTGATRDKSGLFEEAQGGTIFLDEIEKITATVQAKLLHVLDRGEIRPVGATRSRKVDARVICATSADLRTRIAEGRFLEDLYYRLNDITVRVPALRERREDIPVLAQHFLALYSRRMDKPLRGFAPEVMQLFLDLEWRGNVRELEKTVKRMVVLADEGDVLGVPLLPPELQERISATQARITAARDGERTLRHSVGQLERQMIGESLERHRGNKARVARELGLSYPTLLAKIRLHQLEARRARRV
jgi:Nif-specific regulatory protein